jgi:conjugal transfer/type IV secretion protein DotA/TraY
VRRTWIVPLALTFVAIAVPVLAQTNTGNNYDVSWSALNPGDDWAAQVINSIFPISSSSNSSTTSTGAEATVIGSIVGQFTAFVAAIAMAFVCYNTIVNIHRAAETARVLANGMTWLFVVRVGFAGIMMFPLGSGFSTGQAAVVQAAMWGIGMARAVYTNAVKAIGPDSMVIAQPMIPGTKNIVLGLMEDELCMDLANLISHNSNMVPIPQPMRVQDVTNGGYITYNYSMKPGDETGTPICGSVTIREPLQGNTNIAGVSVDMTGTQQTILNNILSGDLRSQVQQVAQNLWNTRQAAALAPLQSVLIQATNDYTQQLTSAATKITSSLRNALQNAAEARNGNVGLVQNEVELSSLGWTSAGAYYLEFARLNGQTLSLLNATPNVTTPSYTGLSRSLSYDMAPLAQSVQDYMAKLDDYAETTDGLSSPSGAPELYAGATPNQDKDGAGVIEQIFRKLSLSDSLLTLLQNAMLPNTQIWTDPFSGLMQLGDKLIVIAITALGIAALLSSGTVAAGTALFHFLTFDWGAAAATTVAHFVVKFLGIPIYTGCLALLLPGITIAFVLPMIPWLMWVAGVAGWLVLVCEAVIAVPLWMLAHMTFGGEGLHGRAGEGYGLIFNVLFRPTLMLIGLFLGYFIFDCMSWLIRMSFGIASGFVLQNGWLVTNFVGIAVLLSIFVMAHIMSALVSFRMIALVPHHLPRLIGFMSANRVDMEDFSNRTGWFGMQRTVSKTEQSLVRMAGVDENGERRLPRGPAGYLQGPGVGATNGGPRVAADTLDSTMRATTDTPPSFGGTDDA